MSLATAVNVRILLSIIVGVAAMALGIVEVYDGNWVAIPLIPAAWIPLAVNVKFSPGGDS